MITLLTCLESSLGVVNACLPVSKPVFDKLKPASLIEALSGYRSRERSDPSSYGRMPAEPKQGSVPLVDQEKRDMQRRFEESAVNLPDAVWSPPSSPRKGSE